MGHEKPANWGRASFAAFALLFLAANQPAQGECLSPSTPAGATVTTVYRCPEIDPSAAKQPSLASPEKTTVVERGSSDVPWFEPKPEEARTEAAKQEIETIKAPEKEIEAVKAPEKKIKTADAPETDEAVQVRKKTVTKKKLAGKKQVKKIKVARSKKTKENPTKVKPATETAKIESVPPDEKTIVWTKKDMPLGSRIVNWLGF